MAERFDVLSLDGGGSKGVYSLGVLKEMEAFIGAPLYSRFQLIFGTSTGAIIAALLGLGRSVEDIKALYFKLLPDVMQHKRARARSLALAKHAKDIFGDLDFTAFKTRIGIVAMNYDFERPMIFKSHPDQSHGLRSTFAPGFGCSIAAALLASSAAFPLFERVTIPTANQGEQEVMDGGFVANNPTLFAIADAVNGLHIAKEQLRVFSVGVGHYNEPQRNWYSELIFRLWPFEVIKKLFASNTNTIEILRRILFKDVHCVRVDESFPDRRYETDMLEANLEKLERMYVLGRESFGKYEAAISAAFPRNGGQ